LKLSAVRDASPLAREVFPVPGFPVRRMIPCSGTTARSTFGRRVRLIAWESSESLICWSTMIASQSDENSPRETTFHWTNTGGTDGEIAGLAAYPQPNFVPVSPQLVNDSSKTLKTILPDDVEKIQNALPHINLFG
jgi:hypothetical protein